VWIFKGEILDVRETADSKSKKSAGN
jgi:hypothetical protein